MVANAIEIPKAMKLCNCGKSASELLYALQHAQLLILSPLIFYRLHNSQVCDEAG